jgi:redox-sensitive bicupin YhaK (pirin superfamily)
MSGAVELLLTTSPHDIGSFEVRRALPKRERRHIGPFVFFDHMGPAKLAPGVGMDVRPHPHIGLATVTYLFDGEIMHRDSLGYVQAIQPGALNWMVAGRGIVHSERTAADKRDGSLTMHGIQTWVALPPALEECEPSFAHHPAATLPTRTQNGVWLKCILGEAYGLKAPVEDPWPIFYLHAEFPAGSALVLPSNYAERGVYVVSGALEVDGTAIEPGTLAVFKEGADVTLSATASTRAMLLGGATLPGERTIWWNFVSSDKARLVRAKADWKAGNFAKVPGETEFIPLPE